jgi:DNA-directed RNA polymerase specialized sigma24 family protein
VYPIDPYDRLTGFQPGLLAIRQDPQVRRLALKWAGDFDLAEDALQTAYSKVAAVRHPERIANLRAYFLQALKNEVVHQRTLRRAVPLENPEDVVDPDQFGTAMCGLAPARPIDEKIGFSLQAQSWLKRLADERSCLLAAIPARSDDPVRYRAVTCDAAEQALRDGINGEPSDADSNAAFRTAYPEYFAQPGAEPNTLHQRFRRAREDVKALLQAIVSRDELS